MEGIGAVIEAIIKGVSLFGFSLFVACLILLALPPDVGAAILLTHQRLVGGAIILGCITAFAPPPWLKLAAKAIGHASTSRWKLFNLTDRQKRFLGPFAITQDNSVWFSKDDEDLQVLIDKRILWQKDKIWDVVLVKLTDDGRAWLKKYRKQIRTNYVDGQEDEIGKALEREMAEATATARDGIRI
jgi:hypothetical protein